MKVQLTYFKETGKYYSEGSYETEHKPLFKVWQEVSLMIHNGKLPGLIKGATEYIVLAEVPEHEHAHPQLLNLGTATDTLKFVDDEMRRVKDAIRTLKSFAE